MKTKWECVVWCPDCCGQDFQGCFDGHSEVIGEYDTEEEARAAGVKYTDHGIWEFEVRRCEK